MNHYNICDNNKEEYDNNRESSTSHSGGNQVDGLPPAPVELVGQSGPNGQIDKILLKI